MKILGKLGMVAVAALALSAAGQAAAFTAFSDAFEDGDVSDWVVSSSANITGPQVTVRTDFVNSGSGALWTFFDASSGGTGAGFVRASHTFTAPVTADYTLTLSALSAPCSGCTMSYDVIVDGNSLTRTHAPSAFEQRVFQLTGLTAGAHTLTLGMYTDGASSGRFQATFDDVSVTTLAAVPEPETVALMLAGLLVVATASKREKRRR